MAGRVARRARSRVSVPPPAGRPTDRVDTGLPRVQPADGTVRRCTVNLLSALHMRRRLGALLLLALLLAVLTGVSITQAGLIDDGADRLEDTVLPALRRTQDVRRLLDEARGLEALQFLADTEQERAEALTRLKRQRRLVEAQLAAVGRAGEDDEDRRLKALVQERLTHYWAAQDKVLAALAARAAPTEAAEPAPATPAGLATLPANMPATVAAPSARQLLARESQAAWTAVSQALVFWYQHQEQRAADLAARSRSQAQWLRWGGGAVWAVLAALAALRFWRHPRGYAVAPAATTVPPSALPTPGLPETLESIAMHSRLVALNAAVQAARTGAPTDADLAERAHLASEAEALARRCDEARRSMRLGQPKARAASSAAATASGFGPPTRPGEHGTG